MLYASTYYGIAGLGDDTLYHHGIKGQRWGVRRFQYEDGLLTPAGRARYDVGPAEKLTRWKVNRRLNAASDMIADAEYVKRRSGHNIDHYEKKIRKLQKKIDKREDGPSKRQAKKLDRLNQNVAKEKETINAANKTQRDISKIQNKVLKKALAGGYNVQSWDTYKSAEQARHTIAQATGGIAAQMVSRLVSDDMVKSRTYRVKLRRNKDGTSGTYEHKRSHLSDESLKRVARRRNARRTVAYANRLSQRREQRKALYRHDNLHDYLRNENTKLSNLDKKKR